MSIRRIQKALGLLLVDIVIIIGIFVLQFRTDSNIIEKIGNLQITLVRNTSVQTEELILENSLQLSYNGININISNQNPACIVTKNQLDLQPVSLVTYSRNNLQTDFTFTNDIKMSVFLSDDTPSASMNIKVELPEEVTDFYLPYSYSPTMLLQKEEKKSLVLDGKKNSWEFSTPGLENGLVAFSNFDTDAVYAIFDNTKQITFDNINELAIADGFVYQRTIESFKKNLITAFESSLSDNSYSEQAVVSYIAAMAENGNYTQAVDKIPQSFRKSPVRTYLSAPYLNNLEEMNNGFEETIEANLRQITRYKDSSSLDLYTVHNIATNLWLYPDVSTVRNMLIRASNAEIDSATIDQVTGLLKAYLDLSSYKSGYAKYLEPIIEDCIQKILSSCNFERETLTISENGTYLSVSQAVDAGTALLRYGLTYNNDTLTMAGYALINSYIGESSSFDLRTLANIYPMLAFNNPYYPHFLKIFTDNGTTAWAWTCSPEITYTSDTASTCVLSIDFPETWTHYIIIKGIPYFRQIYIYDIPFRTDPRFETYNSSGYVYKSSTNTLLLKSRHKTEKENVRLVFGQVEKTEPTVTQSESAATESTSTESSEKSDTSGTPEASTTETSAPAVTTE